MGVRIQELPETTGINKEDLLIVEDGQGTKKGTVQQLDEALGVSQLKEDLVEITETTEKEIVLEEHPTKNSGYYWNGAFTNSSYFYYHLDVKEGDVVTIPLSISAEALQLVRFIDAYKGTERNADASI